MKTVLEAFPCDEFSGRGEIRATRVQGSTRVLRFRVILKGFHEDSFKGLFLSVFRWKWKRVATRPLLQEHPPLCDVGYIREKQGFGFGFQGFRSIDKAEQ